MKSIMLNWKGVLFSGLLLSVLLLSCELTEIPTAVPTEKTDLEIVPEDYAFVGEAHNEGLNYIYDQLADEDFTPFLTASLTDVAFYVNPHATDFLTAHPSFEDQQEEIIQNQADFETLLLADPANEIYADPSDEEYAIILAQSSLSTEAQQILLDMQEVFNIPDATEDLIVQELTLLMEEAGNTIDHVTELELIYMSGQVGIHSINYWSKTKNLDKWSSLHTNPKFDNLQKGEKLWRVDPRKVAKADLVGVATGLVVGAVAGGILGGPVGAIGGAVAGGVGGALRTSAISAIWQLARSYF